MNKSYFKYILALLLFGSNGIVAGYISLTSYEIVFWHTIIGNFLLILIFLLTKRKFTYTNSSYIRISRTIISSSIFCFIFKWNYVNNTNYWSYINY